MLLTYFNGLVVVELASVLAGPLVGSFLSELGADVIKIENKTTNGDVTRHWKNIKEDPASTSSAYYSSANYNKKTVFLDFKDPNDLKGLYKLISTADIVLSNYQKRVGEKFQIDPYTITTQFPNIIFVQLNAYTYDDPRPGFDMVMQAEAGYISMCGTESGELVKMPVALMDVLASHQMKEGLLISLLEKAKTGKGSIVHVSLYKSAISGLVNQGSNYLNQGLIAQPIGTMHPNISPYGDIVHSKEGSKIMLAIGSDAHFAALIEVLNIEKSLVKQFKLNVERLVTRGPLISLLNEYTSKIGLENLLALLSSRGIPYGIIKNMEEVFNDALAKQMILPNNNKMLTISNVAFEINEN